MRVTIRPVLIALSIACVAAVFSADGALAQAKQETAPAQAAQPPLKQIPLTEKQIQGVLAAQKDMDAITSKLPDNAQPDAKVLAQLDAAARGRNLRERLSVRAQRPRKWLEALR